MSRTGLLLQFILALSLSTPAFCDDEDTADSGVSLAGREVALEAKRNAVAATEGLLARTRGTDQEGSVLYQLGEMLQQQADLEFVIAQEKATGGKADLSLYQQTMSRSASVLGKALVVLATSKHGKKEDLPRVHFLRGNALREIKKKQEARKELEMYLVSKPKDRNAYLAHLWLGDMYYDSKDYTHAIEQYLSIRSEKRPEFDLHVHERLAWSYYWLDDVGSGLKYLGQAIEVIKSKQEFKGQYEKLLLDVAQFYIRGVEKKISGFTSERAIGVFSKYDEGEIFGSMCLAFAQHLRAKDHDEDLRTFKTLLARQQPKLPQTWDVAALVFEYELQNYRIDEVKVGLLELLNLSGDLPLSDERKELSASVESQSLNPRLGEPSRKLILDTARRVAEYVRVNPDRNNVQKFRATLVFLYELYIRGAPSGDPVLFKVRMALAENYLGEKEYAKAARQFWSIAKTGNDKEALDAKIKAIGALFEEFKVRNYVPGKLAAKSLKQNREGDPSPAIQEWMRWMDEVLSPETLSRVEGFVFESGRLLYHQGLIEKSIHRLQDFVQKYPDSKFAQPSATLIVDTYAATGDWSGLEKVVQNFKGIPQLEKAGFGSQLNQVVADSKFNQLEEKRQLKDHASVLQGAGEFLGAYPKHAMRKAVLLSAIAAAAALGDRSSQGKYVETLNQEFPDASTRKMSSLYAVSNAENSYDFATASQSLYSYVIGLPPVAKRSQEDLVLRGKVLLYSWLNGKPSELESRMADARICVPELKEVCDRYSALLRLMTRDSSQAETGLDKNALGRVMGGFASNRAIYAASFLQQPEQMPFQYMPSVLSAMGSGLSQLDEMARAVVMAQLSQYLPKFLDTFEKEFTKSAPPGATLVEFQARVQYVEKLEQVFKPWLDLQQSSLAVEVASRLGNLYQELIKEVPNGADELKQKLVQQSSLRRERAFEKMNENSVDPLLAARVADAYFKEVTPPQTTPHTPKLGSLKLNADQWAGLVKASDPWKSAWMTALQLRNWQRMAYLHAQGSEKNTFEPGGRRLAQATLWMAMGASGEAVRELDGVLKESTDSTVKQSAAAQILVSHVASYNRTHAVQCLDVYLEDDHSSPDRVPSSLQSAVILYSAKWLGRTLEAKDRSRLEAWVKKESAVAESDLGRSVLTANRKVASKPGKKTTSGENP